IFFALRHPGTRRLLNGLQVTGAGKVLISWLGVTIAAAGVALALWARVNIGRNWGMPGTQKEGADLVTTGPYAFIRHPIYTGFLLALFGTALTEGPVLLVAVAVLGSYFIYNARREERIMNERFPDAYPAYKRRTKMLVPFIL